MCAKMIFGEVFVKKSDFTSKYWEKPFAIKPKIVQTLKPKISGTCYLTF